MMAIWVIMKQKQVGVSSLATKTILEIVFIFGMRTARGYRVPTAIQL